MNYKKTFVLLFIALTLGGFAFYSCQSQTSQTQDLGTWKISSHTVLGFDSAEPAQPPESAKPELIPEPYDVIIVGGGLSGLTAAWYLRDHKILVLEREKTAGGLAFSGKTSEGITYGRGAAYYSKPRGRVAKIYKELGMDPVETTAIHEPIDSYFYKGTLYRGVWEEETLDKLPVGFRNFKKALLEADEKNLVPEQPIEEAKDLSLDSMTAAEFISPFGPEVKEFLDSYCQSALGAKTDQVNAIVFLNFYLAEIETRYAWAGGTAGASAGLIAKLHTHNPAILRTGQTVTRVKNSDSGVDVVWHDGTKIYQARAKYAILAIPLKVSAWILDDFPLERKKLIEKLNYADYLLHNVFTSKDLFTASYDTWFSNCGFTDLIVARWIETEGFHKRGPPTPGILTIYQPLAPSHGDRGENFRNLERVKALGLAALTELKDLIPELDEEKDLRIESYRWPASIHVVPPRFFSEWVPQLKAPVKKVYFAGNNLGTPSFEEALFRGWRAAKDIESVLLLPR